MSDFLGRGFNSPRLHQILVRLFTINIWDLALSLRLFFLNRI